MLQFDVNDPGRIKMVRSVIRQAIDEVIKREVKLCVPTIEQRAMELMPKIELECLNIFSDYGKVGEMNVILKIVEQEVAEKRKPQAEEVTSSALLDLALCVKHLASFPVVNCDGTLGALKEKIDSIVSRLQEAEQPFDKDACRCVYNLGILASKCDYCRNRKEERIKEQ